MLELSGLFACLWGELLSFSGHTIKPGTPERVTRNTGGIAEHPGILAEQWNTPENQRNTNGKPRNNGTLHDEEQLHLNVDYKLKFNEHLESYLKKAGRNVNASLRIVPYKNFEGRRIFMNFFYVTVGFYYCPFVRMFCSIIKSTISEKDVCA